MGILKTYNIMWTSGNPLHTSKMKIEVLNIESCRIGIDKAQWVEIRFLISNHSCSQILIDLLQSLIRNPEANQKINIQILRAKFVLMSFKNGVVIFLQSGSEYSVAWLCNGLSHKGNQGRYWSVWSRTFMGEDGYSYMFQRNVSSGAQLCTRVHMLEFGGSHAPLKQMFIPFLWLAPTTSRESNRLEAICRKQMASLLFVQGSHGFTLPSESFLRCQRICVRSNKIMEKLHPSSHHIGWSGRRGKNWRGPK